MLKGGEILCKYKGTYFGYMNNNKLILKDVLYKPFFKRNLNLYFHFVKKIIKSYFIIIMIKIKSLFIIKRVTEFVLLPLITIY